MHLAPHSTGRGLALRIGIVACETFRRELDMITRDDDEIVHKEYLEFGLHEYPEDLKRTVVQKVNALKGKVDAVFLGYGYCQSLKGITEKMAVPTIMIEADDCVGAFLTPIGYERERKKCAGTWYATPAFCEMGRAWFQKRLESQMPAEQRKELEEAGIDASWFLSRLFEGYSRALFIDTGIGDREYFEALSRQFASELNLRHECCEGTLSLVKEALQATKELAERAN